MTTPQLPPGYVDRPFRDSDREPLIAARNSEAHPVQQGSADEWREWERLAPPQKQVRLVVERSDEPVALGEVQSGFMPRADGSLNVSVRVAPEHRRRGIGSALLEAMEQQARRLGAPAALSSADENVAGALAWATKRGYRAIGRRIESYVELDAFDPSAYSAETARVSGSGLRSLTFAERLEGAGDEQREGFIRELWEVQRPMWEDIPFSRPTAYWPYEQFKRMAFGSGKLLPDCSVLALDDGHIVGLTMTGTGSGANGHTFMTGVARTHRGRGIAFALKVEALRRAKERGLRAMVTTNDEPNKAMRGINARLGYRMLPARVELEKQLA